jgi:hypothetical protein
MGIFNLKFAGYSTPREFYAPKYDIVTPEQERPDMRATIFWAPIIRTDSTGNATVSFFNSDNETTVTGIMEGISTYGTPGAGTFSYDVKKR